MQQVAEVKCLTRIILVWSSGIVYVIVLTLLGNYVGLPATQTNRWFITSSDFQIPHGSFIFFQMLALTFSIPLYGRLLVSSIYCLTNRSSGITLLQRIGIGLALSVATMLVSTAGTFQGRHPRPSPTMMPWCWLVP